MSAILNYCIAEECGEIIMIRKFVFLLSMSASIVLFGAEDEFQSAVYNKNCDKVKVLLESGVSANVAFQVLRNENRVPAIYVSSSQIDRCTTAALVEHGADLNHEVILGASSSDMFVATPLIAAIRYNNLEAAKMLLELGADPNPVDAQGSSLLDQSLVMPEGDKAKIREINNILIKYKK